jgi:hypothetical protein
VLPFTAGEVNLVMQPGPSGSAVTVLLDGQPVGDAHGADLGADGVARFDRSGPREAGPLETYRDAAQFRGPIEEREYGRVIMMIVPGADDMQLYQPTHKLAYNL